MAMISCAECGIEVSTSAKSCPACGASRKAMRRRARRSIRKVIMWIGGGILAFAVVMSIIAVHNPPPPKSDREQKEDTQEAARIHAGRTAILALKPTLRNPDSVVFEQIGVTEDGGVTCIVYRAQNGFGGMSRELFVATGKGTFATTKAWHSHCAGKPLYDYTNTLPMAMKWTG